MKLLELIGVNSDDLQKSLSNIKNTEYDDFKQLTNYLQNHGITGDDLGSGYYSVVVSTDEEPGTVRKVTFGGDGRGYEFDDLVKDGYFNYIIAMAEKSRMDWNPYLPKIYDVKFYKSKDGLIAFTVEMERLYNIEELSFDEVMFIGNKITNDFDEVMRGRLEYYQDADDEYKRNRALGAIMDIIEWSAHRGSGTVRGMKISDSRFRHAIKIITKLSKSDKGALDIHQGNIMFRRTPYGPQLVLTDPLS